jgi:hypothetical protein
MNATPQYFRSAPIKLIHDNEPLTFGAFVAGVYHAWGKRKAKGIVSGAGSLNVI